MKQRLNMSTLFACVLIMALVSGTGSTYPTVYAATFLTRFEAEAMTNAGGCTGMEATRVRFYCNADAVFSSYSFSGSGSYSVTVRGASSNASAAGISVYIGGTKQAALSFPGTGFSNQSALFTLSNAGSKEVRLKLETDTGANDTIVDYLDLYYEGPVPTPQPGPQPPSVGAFSSGSYRNMFAERGYSASAIQARLDAAWNSLFASTDDTKRVYYSAGSNANGQLAYIKDIGNGDVRSEGMSYGMMIAVQMNKQAEFKALWNWAKTYMQHQSGPRAGYFAWQCSTNGDKMDNNPASDGEEYFATALFFASGRWGNGSGIYNYRAEADAILNTMLHKEDMNGGVVDSVTNMFNRSQKQVVFTPYASAATFTDPSYHLPAFYELWGRWAAGYNGQQASDRQFWRDAAGISRSFFAATTHPSTGLAPDYAEFNGTPNNTGNHGDFRFDAWRVASNIAVDYAWFAADPNQKALSNRIQAFFQSQGITTYANQYTLSGTALSSDHSPGLVSMNAVASLAATDQRAWLFIDELWNLTPPTGQWRYYDGMLYFMALLHVSGNFRIYPPSGTTPPTATPIMTATATVATITPAGPTSTLTATATPVSGGGVVAHIETEQMTRTGGNTLSQPFVGVILYGNGDNVKTNYAFPTSGQSYVIQVRGASSNSMTATTDVYVNGNNVGTLSHTGSAATIQSTAPFVVNTNSPVVIELRCVNDVGQWDSYLDYLEIK